MSGTELVRWYADVSKMTPRESSSKRGIAVFIPSPPGDCTTTGRAVEGNSYLLTPLLERQIFFRRFQHGRTLQKRHRIYRRRSHAYFVVQMRRGHASGGAYQPNGFTLPDFLAGQHVDFREVCVIRVDAV